MNHSTTSHHDETTTPRPMSFITMTDILNAINNNNNNNHCSSTSCFELQRRLPDGSTRKASPSEQAAADCQTRLQQACQLLTTTLSSQDERYEWAETQRHYGNQLYQQQQYEHAIQVYLTCLPAVARIASNQEEEEEENRGMETNEQQQQQEEEQQRRLLLYGKIMNNLAQSCLQLQWYRKAETFCTMALDYLQDYNNKDPIVISKLYYRRGKARRCRGEFGSAKADLERAFEYAFNDTTRAIIIQNELNQVHQKAVQAKRNHQQHKIALQKVMQSTTKKNNNGVFISQSAAPTNNRRPYSTLRATSRVVENPTTVEDTATTTTTTELSSYWQYYMSIVGKVAAALLSILEQQQQQQHHQLHEKIE